MDLKSQQCTTLDNKELSALNQEEINTFLAQVESFWQLNTNDPAISADFSFKNYYQTMAFVNVVAQIAHQQDHHPDIQFSYKRCTITYSTHSVNGLSVKDFICAAKINAALNL